MFPFFTALLMVLRSVYCHARKRPMRICQELAKRGNSVNFPICFSHGLPSEYTGRKGNRFPVFFCVTTIYGKVMLRQANCRPGFYLLRSYRVLKAFAANLPYRMLEWIRYVISEAYLLYVVLNEHAEEFFSNRHIGYRPAWLLSSSHHVPSQNP